MRRSIFLGIILILAASAIYAQTEQQKLYIDLAVGYGISGSEYSFTSAKDFGNIYFSDSTLFPIATNLRMILPSECRSLLITISPIELL